MNSEESKFDKVKRYYEEKLWDKSRVNDAVKCKWITPEQYEMIIGESYE